MPTENEINNVLNECSEREDLGESKYPRYDLRAGRKGRYRMATGLR